MALVATRIHRGAVMTVYALTRPNGRCDFNDFRVSLAEDERQRLDALVVRLADYGSHPSQERFRRELKNVYALKGHQVRVLSFYGNDGHGRSLVLTHGFKKKKDKMPPTELERAVQLRTEFVTGGTNYEP